MGVLTVVHTGLGLWIDRGDSFEVLFPKAENCPHPITPSCMLKAHDPVLRVPKSHRKGETVSVYDLRGCTLDLRAGTGDIARTSVKQAFMFPLEVEHGAPAHDAGGAFSTHRERVTARARFSRGVLTPAEHALGGPITFAKESNLLIAFSIAFSVSFTGHELHGTVHNEFSGTTEKLLLKPDDTGAIVLKLECLSLLDQQTGEDEGPDSPIDFDFAANYLLTCKEIPKPPIDVPKQPAPAAPKAGGADVAASNLSMFSRPPQHFCSLGFASNIGSQT